MRRRLLPLLLAASVPSCDDAGSASSGACGDGATRVELGTAHPFEPVEGGRYVVQRGTQGGFHVDVSLRVRGALDPEHSDVDLKLLDGERVLAEHVNDDTLLFPGGGGCDYDMARLVFSDGGGLMAEAQVLALTGRPLTLRVAVTSGDGGVRGDHPVVLDAPGTSPCGRGEVAVELGVGHPFAPLAEPRLPIQRGLQGGFHVDLSVRARGALDPDATDVDLRLVDGEQLLAQHVNEGSLLVVNEAPLACDYVNARMVLVDAEGGLLREDAAIALAGRPLTLKVRLGSALGSADVDVPLTLAAPE